jgi:DNA mismatch endonuclease (patch repair protein)
MVDVVDKATRSRMMSGIRATNTKPELLLRSMLHRQGIRFRLHASNLPGKPDMVLPKFGAVIFIHGCFWHGHECPVFKWPKTREAFWREKILRNQANDRKAVNSLIDTGWRVAVVWECALRDKPEQLAKLIQCLGVWLRSTEPHFEQASARST